jgi:hypothetical protein
VAAPHWPKKASPMELSPPNGLKSELTHASLTAGV